MMTRFSRLTTAAIMALTLGAACDDGDGAEGEGEPWTAVAFTGGTFDVAISDVDDQCFDGAMVTAILPEGADTTASLPQPIELPTLGAGTVDLYLNRPFQDVPDVPIEANDDSTGFTTSGGGFDNTGVRLGGTDDDPCMATMKISVDITLIDDDSFDGTASLTVSEAKATGVDNCPTFTNGPPCTVTAKIAGSRQ